MGASPRPMPTDPYAHGSLCPREHLMLLRKAIDRQLWSSDLKLSWARVWAGAATKYIFAQGCCLGAIQRISAWRSRISSRALLVPIAIGLNLRHFPTVWQGFKPVPDCGFDRLVDTNETAPTYK